MTLEHLKVTKREYQVAILHVFVTITVILLFMHFSLKILSFSEL